MKSTTFPRARYWLGFLLVIGSWQAGCRVERQQSIAQPAEPNPPPVNAVDENKEQLTVNPETSSTSATTELATFGSGCFWCVEAVFQQLDGVLKVESGYSGGHVPNPTYEMVCNKTTGHAEVCQLTFDPKKITFDELLEVFWKTHDPTTPNQQGYDIGPQYRSAIFYHSEQQRDLAEKYKRALDAAGAFNAPIVTEITAYKNFYKAEDYHQNYFLENSNDRYCRAIIQPKVEKFRKVFAAKLKSPEP